MSRSYRKPYWTQGYGGHWRSVAKRQDTKRVRQTKFAASGSYYKRISNSWDICDFKFYDTGESARAEKARRK